MPIIKLPFYARLAFLLVCIYLKKYTMTTKEVADKLVKMCREGKVEEVKQELFPEDILSIERKEGILPKETKGFKGDITKG